MGCRSERPFVYMGSRHLPRPRHRGARSPVAHHEQCGWSGRLPSGRPDPNRARWWPSPPRAGGRHPSGYRPPACHLRGPDRSLRCRDSEDSWLPGREVGPRTRLFGRRERPCRWGENDKDGSHETEFSLSSWVARGRRCSHRRSSGVTARTSTSARTLAYPTNNLPRRRDDECSARRVVGPTRQPQHAGPSLRLSIDASTSCASATPSPLPSQLGAQRS